MSTVLSLGHVIPVNTLRQLREIIMPISFRRYYLCRTDNHRLLCCLRSQIWQFHGLITLPHRILLLEILHIISVFKILVRVLFVSPRLYHILRTRYLVLHCKYSRITIIYVLSKTGLQTLVLPEIKISAVRYRMWCCSRTILDEVLLSVE